MYNRTHVDFGILPKLAGRENNLLFFVLLHYFEVSRKMLAQVMVNHLNGVYFRRYFAREMGANVDGE